MAFVANKDMKVEASQADDGSFVLRSKGLEGRRRPELEIAGVPEPALHAAAALLNEIAEYAVNVAEVKSGETVGLSLSHRRGDEQASGPPLLIGLHAIEREPPKGGFFAKLSGAGRGLLRLVDAAHPDRSTPIVALATMLVHRASARSLTGDFDGARKELETSIAMFPGEATDAAPPTFEGVSGLYNWQNHAAYLALASLDEEEGDLAAADQHVHEALVRSEPAARSALSARLDERREERRRRT